MVLIAVMLRSYGTWHCIEQLFSVPRPQYVSRMMHRHGRSPTHNKNMLSDRQCPYMQSYKCLNRTKQFCSAGFVSLMRMVRRSTADGEKKGFSALSVLCDNECFVRENPSPVTSGRGNVRESYVFLAFNPRDPAPAK